MSAALQKLAMVDTEHESPSALSALEDVLKSVRKEYEELKEGAALYETLSGRLRAVYDNPPVAECNLCIVGANFSADELRFIMFAPTAKQVEYYPLFIRDENAQGGPNSRPKSIFLTLLYLLHR